MAAYRFRDILLMTGYGRAFDYVANPYNLPAWTDAFEEAADERATLSTPAGRVEIGLQVRASREHGTIDWSMTFPDGSCGRACSRLVELEAGITHYGFVLTPPPGPLEELEGTLDRQAEILEGELERLSEILATDEARRRA